MAAAVGIDSLYDTLLANTTTLRQDEYELSVYDRAASSVAF
jgi:hypothetical protein